MTLAPEFIAASPLRDARRCAAAELHGNATPSDVASLYAQPLLWLRALQRIRRDVETHIGKDRSSIAHLAPGQGENASSAYLEALNEVRARSAKRLHFKQIVETRIEEVKALLGPESAVGFMTVGDLIEIMSDISMLADEGDLAAAADKANFWAKRWTERVKRGLR